MTDLKDGTTRYAVRSFSVSALNRAFEGKRPFERTKPAGAKTQVRYLASYLNAIRCRTLVVEHPYICVDYLDDYAAYYVRCFPDYGRWTRRIHFFRSQFSQAEFDAILEGRTTARPSLLTRRGTYLGFSVAKPLPDVVVGRTCVATYPPARGRRHYPTRRDYKTHLAGYELTVSSLAFQEQDTVVAACATTALWSALHKAGDLFSNRVPTQVEITRAATSHGSQNGRTLPSHGLDVRQLCRATSALGYEVELREGKQLRNMKGILYGYGQYGLPSVLGLTVPGGKHAVTVSGYSIPPKSVRPPRGFALLSDRINELYVHDDTFGPFRRAPVVSPQRIQLQRIDNAGRPIIAPVFAIVVPVYPKIRITFEEAVASLGNFHWANTTILPGIEWDLRLTSANRFQSDCSNDAAFRDVRARLLAQAWPRFIWRATARSSDGEPWADVIFDATGIQRSFFGVSVIVVNAELKAAYATQFADRAKRRLLASKLGPQWTKLLLEALA